MLELAPPRVDAPSSPRVRTAAPVVALGLLGALLGFAGSWIPSYWGDEAASVMSASRPFSSLANELSRIDAVHGAYYAFLHVWVNVFGTSELATRLPSAIAVGFMVAGTVVLVRRFTTERVAILAGIVCAILPRTTYMATEARSYAIATAVGVWVTVLLVRCIREDSGVRWWIGYALAAAAGVYVFLYLGLLLVVHGAFVAIVHRRVLARWGWAAAAAIVLAMPIVAIAYAQRHQIAFLARRDYVTATHVLTSQWFGWTAVAVMAWALILVAVITQTVAFLRRRAGTDDRGSLVLLATLWLVIPTASILLADELVTPVYNVRYLSLSTPAAGILVALGITAVASFAPAARRRLVGAGIVVALVAACVPVYIGQRTSWAKDNGSDLREVASYVGDHADAGDAVVFDQSTKPSRDPRLALNLYPAEFSGLRDVALRTPFTARRALWDRVTPNPETALRIVADPDVWAIELPVGYGVPKDVSFLSALGYEIESVDRIHRTVVYHLVKD